MTKRLRNLTQEDVWRLFTYDPETGHLVWNRRDDVKTSWNARFAGKIAGSVDPIGGYRRVRVNRVHYQAHQIIWLYVHGYWADEIDHENHNRDDNRLVNLRDVTRLDNAKNHTLQSNNTSGYVGVSRIKTTDRWRAYIYRSKVHYLLGTFDTVEEAARVRMQAANDLNFHHNHGKMAA